MPRIGSDRGAARETCLPKYASHDIVRSMSTSILSLKTPEEAGRIIGVSSVRIRQFCRQGRIGQKVGERWVISLAELQKFDRIPRTLGRPPVQL